MNKLPLLAAALWFLGPVSLHAQGAPDGPRRTTQTIKNELGDIPENNPTKLRVVFKNDNALAAVKEVKVTFKVDGTDVTRVLKQDRRCQGGTNAGQSCAANGDCPPNGTCPEQYYAWVLEANETITLPNGAEAKVSFNCGRFNPHGVGNGPNAAPLAIISHVELFNGTTPLASGATVIKQQRELKKLPNLRGSSFGLEVSLYNDEDVSVTFANILVYKDQPISNYTLDAFRNLQGVPEAYSSMTVPPRSSAAFNAGTANSTGYLCVVSDVSLSSTPGATQKTWSAASDDPTVALPASPVPDGNVVAGIPMKAGKDPDGISIDVLWDATMCQSFDYNLFYGDLTSVSDYDYAGAECALGNDGAATFMPPTNVSTFWVIAPVTANDIEGSHGFDSNEAHRPASAGSSCSVQGQVLSSTCP